MKLSQAKAVVTGGASGLGFASAQRVIDEGGRVVLLDVNDELGNERAAEEPLRRAIALDPECAPAHSYLYLGLSLWETGRG